MRCKQLGKLYAAHVYLLNRWCFALYGTACTSENAAKYDGEYILQIFQTLAVLEVNADFPPIFCIGCSCSLEICKIFPGYNRYSNSLKGFPLMGRHVHVSRGTSLNT